MADAKQQQQQQQPQQAAAAATGVWKTVKPFVNGGASGMLATCVIQPIDMVKVPYHRTALSLLHSASFTVLVCELVRRGRGVAALDLREWGCLPRESVG